MKTWLPAHLIALGLVAAIGARAGNQPRATAELRNTQGEKVGQATFVGKRNGVLIQIEIDNLQPGTYGFHIHERGSCRGTTFKSAGQHFNPSGARHGFKDAEGPHAGDLWNLEVPDGRHLSVKQYSARVTLKEDDDNSVLREGGTSLIVHANRDDYRTDPTGDAGAGIACGVIKRTAPPREPVLVAEMMDQAPAGSVVRSYWPARRVVSGRGPIWRSRSANFTAQIGPKLFEYIA